MSLERLVREGTKSLPQLAKDLDLTESALRQWVQQADLAEGKAAAGALGPQEREELVRLRRENRQLLVLPCIFEPFFTAKAIGVGTGLGLSICHSYVEAVGVRA